LQRQLPNRLGELHALERGVVEVLLRQAAGAGQRALVDAEVDHAGRVGAVVDH
jgi:hypothetical protein